MYEYQKRIFEDIIKLKNGSKFIICGTPMRREGARFVSVFNPRAEMLGAMDKALREREAEKWRAALSQIPPMSDFLRGFAKKEEPMEEIVVNGVKYKRVAEKESAQLSEFKLVGDIVHDELDLMYKGHRVMSFTREGKFRLAAGIPNDIGLTVDNDGEMFEESTCG